VHILLSLPATLSLAKAMQLIKGSSSHWMNEKWGLAHACSAKTEAAPPFAVFERWARRTQPLREFPQPTVTSNLVHSPTLAQSWSRPQRLAEANSSRP
jgi:hypothetical protein